MYYIVYGSVLGQRALVRIGVEVRPRDSDSLALNSSSMRVESGVTLSFLELPKQRAGQQRQLC